MKTLTMTKSRMSKKLSLEDDEVYQMFMRALEDLKHGRISEWKPPYK
ncbi:MAG: hypothetical protein HY393_01380 [Candidatus Diapherotrites archaeon]|nr:hypothetical protein [Candidatus Diapherotrites archaeon]